MTSRAFTDPTTHVRPVQGTVTAVGVDAVDCRYGSTIMRNCSIAKPLTIDDLHLFDVVAITWVGDSPVVTSVLGQETALKFDAYEDVTPPLAVSNLRRVQTTWGDRAEWDFNFQLDPTFAYFEVDGRQPGGSWGYDAYPVNNGQSLVHFPMVDDEPIQIRVKSVDVRGNESAWVVLDELLIDEVAPPVPTQFSIQNAISGIIASWAFRSVPDLAGFKLYAADDDSGTNAEVVQVVGPNTSTFYYMYPGTTRYFNLSSFDRAGNESDLAVSTWLEGYSQFHTGEQLTTNADLERDYDGDGVPDEWTMDDDDPDSTMTWGNYGIEGGKGIEAWIDGASTLSYKVSMRWPGSLSTWKTPAFVGYYTVSIYVKSTRFSEIVFHAPVGASPPAFDDAITFTISGYAHDGSTGALIATDAGAYTVEEITNGWYRISRTIKVSSIATYPYIGFYLYIWNTTSTQVTIYLDRPMLEIGQGGGAWKPGLTPGGGTSMTGLKLDVAGIESTYLKIDKTGKIFSDLLPDATGTRNLGSSSLHWDVVYADSLVGSASHDPVNLDTNADTLLSLSTQELGLDTQSANVVFAGPSSGGDAVPTFRSLVAADFSGGIDHDDLSNVTSEQHQDLVTLATSLGANLLGLTGQELSLDEQLQNLVFASPDASTGVPSFRKAVLNDISVSGSANDLLGLSGATTWGWFTPSSNPGTGSSILKSAATTGRLDLLTLGVDTLEDRSGSDLTIAPDGNIVVNPAGDQIVPTNNYDVALGTSAKKFSELHAAELVVETLVAAQTIGVIGGRAVIGPSTTTFIQDLSDTAVNDTNKSVNAGFETAGGGGADVFASWTESWGDGTIADETSDVHSGSHALKMIAGSSVNTLILQQYSVTEGDEILFAFWTHGDGTYAGRYRVYDVTNTTNIIGTTDTEVTGTTYTKVYVKFTVPSGCETARIYFYCSSTSGGTAYFDDVEVYDAVEIRAKHNSLSEGDIAYAEGGGNVEFFEIFDGPNTMGSEDYQYWVLRDLDSTGENTWLAGSALFNTGAAGDGFIDLYATSAIGDSSTSGPTIIGNVRESIVYNDWSPFWAVGNLRNLYGTGGNDYYGIGLGDYASDNYLLYDNNGGFRLSAGGGEVIIDEDGISIGLPVSQYLDVSAYTFHSGSNIHSGLYGQIVGSPDYKNMLYLHVKPISGYASSELYCLAEPYSTTGDSLARFGAMDYGLTDGAYATFDYDTSAGEGTVVITGDIIQLLPGPVAVNRLNVGALTDPGDNNLSVAGYIIKSEPISCKVYRTTDQTSVGVSTWTEIYFDAEEWDNDPGSEMHSTSSNTDRIYARTAGKYRVTAHADLEYDATATEYQMRIMHYSGSNVTVAARNFVPINGESGQNKMSISTEIDMAANEYVFVQVRHNATSAIDVLVSSGRSPQLILTRLA